MHAQKSNSKLKNIAISAGIILLGLAWVATEIRFQKYESYAKTNNCEWQMINGEEICK